MFLDTAAILEQYETRLQEGVVRHLSLKFKKSKSRRKNAKSKKAEETFPEFNSKALQTVTDRKYIDYLTEKNLLQPVCKEILREVRDVIALFLPNKP